MRGDNITFRTLEIALLRAGLAVGLVVLATGCQRKYWYQEGKTFDECKADHEDCWAELRRRSDLRYPSSYTHQFLENCMRQRGYELVTQKDLPLDVKREDAGRAVGRTLVLCLRCGRDYQRGRHPFHRTAPRQSLRRWRAANPPRS